MGQRPCSSGEQMRAIRHEELRSPWSSFTCADLKVPNVPCCRTMKGEALLCLLPQQGSRTFCSSSWRKVSMPGFLRSLFDKKGQQGMKVSVDEFASLAFSGFSLWTMHSYFWEMLLPTQSSTISSGRIWLLNPLVTVLCRSAMECCR